MVAVDSKQAKLRYGYETSKVHKELKKPRLLISHETQRERETERERGKTSFSWLRVVRVEEVSTDLGLPNTFFNMMLMLLLLPTTPARKRAESRSSKIQIRAEQLQCFNLQKSCHKTTNTR